ncbi:hypothetical protein [Streptomyces sp. NPDC059142]|uniref:hypothetical protein n=1 Tax=Streptomyces sp. NPDC059142 TaxID=3346739 RepID=UPI003697A92F
MAGTLREPYATEARAIFDSLHGAARAEQNAVDLPPVLERTRKEITDLVGRANTAQRDGRSQGHPASAPEGDTRGTADPAPVPAPRTSPVDRDETGADSDGTVHSGRFEAESAEAAARLGAELAAVAKLDPGARIQVIWQTVEQT